MILITGSKGYIGSAIASRFEDVIHYDIQDGQDVLDIPPMSADAVIHCAAIPHPRAPGIGPIPYFETNVRGTLMVATRVKTPIFIYISSIAVHGLYPGKLKFEEDDTRYVFDRVGPQAGMEPDVFYYAVSKLNAGQWLKVLHLTGHFRLHILRIAPCQHEEHHQKRMLDSYGCYSTPDMVADACVQVLNGEIQDGVHYVYRSEFL